MDFQAMGLCECEVFRSIKAQLSVFVVGNSFVCVCVCVCVFVVGNSFVCVCVCVCW